VQLGHWLSLVEVRESVSEVLLLLYLDLAINVADVLKRFLAVGLNVILGRLSLAG
jgi:hypothetical protein